MCKLIKCLIMRPIMWVLKLVFKLALFVVVILCLALLAGNFWIPTATEVTLTKMSGFKTNVDKSNGSVFKGRVDLKDVEIKNPKSLFKTEDFISISRIVADVDMKSLTKDTIVIEEMIIDIDDITMAKSENGINNYSLFGKKLKEATSSSKTSDSKAKADSKSDSNGKKIFIKKLVFALGTVHNIDESKDTTKEYNVGYRREFTDVSNFSVLGLQLAGDLGKYGLSVIIDSVISSVGNIGGIATDSVIKLKDTSIDAAGKAGESISTGFKKLFGN